MGEEKEAEPTRVEIGFGTVFVPNLEGKSRKHVVIDVGEGNQFFSSSFWKENDKLFVSIAGTTEPHNVKKVLDERLSADDIIEGMKNYLGEEIVSENMINIVRQASKKESRVIPK